MENSILEITADMNFLFVLKALPNQFVTKHFQYIAAFQVMQLTVQEKKNRERHHKYIWDNSTKVCRVIHYPFRSYPISSLTEKTQANPLPSRGGKHTENLYLSKSISIMSKSYSINSSSQSKFSKSQT